MGGIFRIGPKIKNLLDDKGLKQIALIRFLLGKENIESKERTQFSRYLNGIHEYPTDYITKTATFLKVDTKTLLEEQGEYIPPTRKLYILGLSSCGVPSPSFDAPNMDDFTYYTGEEDDVYALRAFGDSMENFISDGDIVIFESLKNNGIKDGMVVHYSYDYGSTDPDDNGIKVYKKRADGSIYLKPLNGKYENIEVSHPEFLKMSRFILVQKRDRRF